MTKRILTYILGNLAHKAILRYKPIVIGITGSVGKTFTKEVIARTLSSHYTIRKTEKNFNNELGVPMTILGITPHLDGFLNKVYGIWGIIKSLFIVYGPVSHPFPRVLVLELGADHPGDIAYLSSMAMPTIGVVTAIGDIPVHVEFYESREALAEEKSKLIKSLVAKESLAVLNYDDPAVLDMKQYAGGNVMTFGFSADATIYASDIRYSVHHATHLGLSFVLHALSYSKEIELPNIIGSQQLGAFLAATAVATYLGISMSDIASSFTEIGPEPGRMNVIDGINNSLVIDDTYNASPIAVRAALTTLNELGNELIKANKIKRKVTILGDMRELGQYTAQAHRDIGAMASGIAEMLVVVGEYADYAIEGAHNNLDTSCIIKFQDSIEASGEIGKYIEEGDLILVKGSQSARMERIVKALMAEPIKSKKLLVRQNEYWLKN